MHVNKKHKAKANKRAAAEKTLRVAAEMLHPAWAFAAAHGVCPLCMIYAAGKLVADAEKNGEIEHGVHESIDMAALILAAHEGTPQ